MTSEPTPLTPEIATQIVEALRSGNARISLTRCYPCQFGEHDKQPHTWMNAEDREHAGISIAATDAEVAAAHPCGCHCNRADTAADCLCPGEVPHPESGMRPGAAADHHPARLAAGTEQR